MYFAQRLFFQKPPDPYAVFRQTEQLPRRAGSNDIKANVRQFPLYERKHFRYKPEYTIHIRLMGKPADEKQVFRAAKRRFPFGNILIKKQRRRLCPDMKFPSDDLHFFVAEQQHGVRVAHHDKFRGPGLLQLPFGNCSISRVYCTLFTQKLQIHPKINSPRLCVFPHKALECIGRPRAAKNREGNMLFVLQHPFPPMPGVIFPAQYGYAPSFEGGSIWLGRFKVRAQANDGVAHLPQQADIRDAQDNKTMAILAYILFFIPLLTGAHKTSAFARYHTNQGTVLFIAAAIYGIAYGILTAVLLFIPVIGWILIMVLGLASIFFLALCIAGIINAANGRMRPLPVIGRITVIK